ncbi:MAG TPA: hypothetical protein VLM40_00375, partial [Gemmata sp.]|nr:hypothetical protein [Gemmata sp.]
MELADIIRILTLVTYAIVAICGVVGWIFWLVKRHARRLDRAEARAEELENERNDAEVRATAAEQRLDSMRRQRDRARADRQRAADIAVHNYRNWEQLRGQAHEAVRRLRASETRVRELEALLATGNQRVTELVDELAIARNVAEEQRQSLERYEAQVELVANQDGRVWQMPPRVPP